jgi:hypothetical protein
MAGMEDAWVFCEEIWVDIGLHEHSGEIWSIHGVILPRFNPCLVPNGRCLIHYHVHPVRVCQDKLVPPSAKDIISLASLKLFVREELQAELKGKVVDCSGIWTYDLTPELVEVLTGRSDSTDTRQQDITGVGPLDRSDLDRFRFFFNYTDRTARFLACISPHTAQSIRVYIKDIAELGVELRYESR